MRSSGKSLNWQEYFVLDPDSPSGLVWNTNIYDSMGRLTKAQKGAHAGSLSGQQRWQVCVHQQNYLCHRIIFEMVTGLRVPDDKIVDHIDGNARNNDPSNLRLTTRKFNNRNKGKMSSNTSGFTGAGFWVFKGLTYVRVHWVTPTGQQRFKAFSVNLYGLLPAFARACRYRGDVMRSLNTNGEGYSERHGK